MILRFKCHCGDRGFVQQNSSLDTNSAIQCDQLYQNTRLRKVSVVTVG